MSINYAMNMCGNLGLMVFVSVHWGIGGGVLAKVVFKIFLSFGI